MLTLKPFQRQQRRAAEQLGRRFGADQNSEFVAVPPDLSRFYDLRKPRSKVLKQCRNRRAEDVVAFYCKTGMAGSL